MNKIEELKSELERIKLEYQRVDAEINKHLGKAILGKRLADDKYYSYVRAPGEKDGTFAVDTVKVYDDDAGTLFITLETQECHPSLFDGQRPMSAESPYHVILDNFDKLMRGHR